MSEDGVRLLEWMRKVGVSLAWLVAFLPLIHAATRLLVVFTANAADPLGGVR